MPMAIQQAIKTMYSVKALKIEYLKYKTIFYCEYINLAIRKILFLTGIFIALLSTAKSQSVINPLTIKDKMQWFSDARIDIFIHAGIYAVNGIDESW